jgi:hypothetical protein
MQGAAVDEPFTQGLRNIKNAIESRLKDSGIALQRLDDVTRESPRTMRGLVMFDVGGNDKVARVSFTLDEIEDCREFVAAYCVRLKINHAINELMS